MRKLLGASLLIGIGLMSQSALAIDHNNIDGGRPLRFDDAYSIAFGERAFEFGFGSSFLRRKSNLWDAKAEFKYGFAKNRDIGIAFEPRYGGGDDRFDVGNVELSYFEHLQREIDNSPALGYKVDLALPTGRGAEGVKGRFRGIVTKTVNQFDKVHLNLDVNVNGSRNSTERDVSFGAIVGYSKPLGYPTKFDQTLVAEFALQQSDVRSEGWTGSVGLGLRKQVGVRSVFDIGIQSDIFSDRGGPKVPLRFVVGYSIGF